MWCHSLTRTCFAGMLLACALPIVTCGNDHNDAGNSSPTPFTPTSPTPTNAAVPNIAGTWRGAYFAVGEISGNDGVMTWAIQQNGTNLTGTFTIQRDLLLGDVSGSLSGTATATVGTTPNNYSLTLSSSSVSGFPGCTLILNAREFSLSSRPTQLNGTYKQALCGRTSNLENGFYQLSRQQQ